MPSTNPIAPRTGSRREFLRSAGRWGGTAALLGLLAWTGRPRNGRAGICHAHPLCTRCPALATCAKPAAIPARQLQDTGLP